MIKYRYRGFVIQPKRDFGGQPHLIKGKKVMKGWVVCYGEGHQYNGCNAMPGACWFQTIKEAKHGIDVLIEVGGEKNSDKFWEIMQPFEYTHVGQKAPGEGLNGCTTIVHQGRFAALIKNERVVKLRRDVKFSKGYGFALEPLFGQEQA